MIEIKIEKNQENSLSQKKLLYFFDKGKVSSAFWRSSVISLVHREINRIESNDMNSSKKSIKLGNLSILSLVDST